MRLRRQRTAGEADTASQPTGTAYETTRAQKTAAVILIVTFLAVVIGGGTFWRMHSRHRASGGMQAMGGMDAGTKTQAGETASKGEITQNAGDVTVTLRVGQLKVGNNEGVLEFRRNNEFVDVKNVKLALDMNMPGMVMHENGKVTPAGGPGQFKVRVKPTMAGDWNAIVSFDGPQGPQKTTIKVTAQ